jgi:hypothetical protein
MEVPLAVRYWAAGSEMPLLALAIINDPLKHHRRKVTVGKGANSSI